VLSGGSERLRVSDVVASKMFQNIGRASILA